MNEKSIAFKAEMVQAILAGQKTQMRQPLRYHASGRVKLAGSHKNWHPFDPDAVAACPYGLVGDRLWVKETFAEVGTCDPGFLLYRASDYMEQVRAHGFDNYLPLQAVKWTPSCVMPRRASRILLEITDVSLEWLQSISDEGCFDEGITPAWCDKLGGSAEPAAELLCQTQARHTFSLYWDSLHGAGSWADNRLVWAVSFKYGAVAG